MASVPAVVSLCHPQAQDCSVGGCEPFPASLGCIQRCSGALRDPSLMARCGSVSFRSLKPLRRRNRIFLCRWRGQWHRASAPRMCHSNPSSRGSIPVLRPPLQLRNRREQHGKHREAPRKGSGSEERGGNTGKTFCCQIFPLCRQRKGQRRCPRAPQQLQLGGQWFCHSQVVVGVGAVLLLPPVDDDDGDDHADDEDGGDDASHDPDDASGGTLR